jgi:hypothetical protein
VIDYASVDKFNDNSTSPSEDNTPHPLDGLAGVERDAAESPLVATDQFRSVMTQVASAVSVVTCALGGQPHGATISAFASLSMEPPTMLVALNRHSGLLHIILQARRFRINVLSADQQEIATWFASKGSPDRFIGLRWKDDDGLPLLFDAQATADWLRPSTMTAVMTRRAFDTNRRSAAHPIPMSCDTLFVCPETRHCPRYEVRYEVRGKN